MTPAPKKRGRKRVPGSARNGGVRLTFITTPDTAADVEALCKRFDCGRAEFLARACFALRCGADAVDGLGPMHGKAATR